MTKLAVERPFPAKAGAEALLANLSRVGIPCAVASSAEIAEVERRLLSSGLRGYFLAIAGGDEVRRGKPDPSVYLLAAQRLGCSPAECLAFEDSCNGIKAAQAAGMAVVAVPDLVAPDTELAFEVLSSLEHAQTHLKRWFRNEARDVFAAAPPAAQAAHRQGGAGVPDQRVPEQPVAIREAISSGSTRPRLDWVSSLSLKAGETSFGISL